MTPITCCERNGYGEHGCCEGKRCPEGRVDLSAILTRRILPTDPRWGVEAALPASFIAIVTTELRPVPFWRRLWAAIRG